MPPRKLEHIDRYEVIRKLGEGGMGNVYLCFDPDLQRYVAIKVIKDTFIHSSQMPIHQRQEYLTRFIREALTTSQLQHPGIPPVHDVRQHISGQIYYVMKAIEGISLREILDGLREGEERITEEYDLFSLMFILQSICQTIMYAHSQGFLHRDLKPSNVFVGNYGEVYVMDWGLTKALKSHPGTYSKQQNTSKETASPDETPTKIDGEPEETLPLNDSTSERNDNTWTVPGRAMGTVSYMAPEQATGSVEKLGLQADVYALGAILYEMLTLTTPVEGQTDKETVQKKLQGQIVPCEEQAPERNVPPELSSIALKALQPDPKDRFSTAKEFYNALLVWDEGKSQFFTALGSVETKEDVSLLPRNTKRGWRIEKDRIGTRPLETSDNAYLLFNKELTGDIRFSLYITPFPLEGSDNDISEFVLVLNGEVPRPWAGFLNCYTIHFGANRNTRAYLAKNDIEVVSNEFFILDPGHRYRVTVEKVGKGIRVLVNRQVVLFYHDSDPLDGLYAGFMHKGENVVFTDISLQTRSVPTKTDAIEIPEALFAEGCYSGALKRFLAIAKGHKNRFEGAWARYRAGMAAFYQTGKRTEARKIWRPLKNTSYAAFEQLGIAMLDLYQRKPLKAAQALQDLASQRRPLLHAEPIADIAFTQAQENLRSEPENEREWQVMDAWVRAALMFGRNLESKTDMMPSILWRWVFMALTRFPDHLEDCILFLRETFGKGRGKFADIVTAIDPLMHILKRSVGMTDHAYLLTKVMRLILNYEDNLGNLETLFRFYLNSGHEEVAEKIALHICYFCEENDYRIPSGPIAFITCCAWLNESEGTWEWLKKMIDNSQDWARYDGLLLWGLEEFRKGNRKDAEAYWQKVKDNSGAQSFNRHLIAKALLEELPADPVQAEVPNRSDHRLAYCLFLGFRYFAEWRHSGTEESRKRAVEAFRKAHSLMRPSYDIYSTAQALVRIPCDEMGEKIQRGPAPEPLSAEEENWLKELTWAASEEESKTAKSSSTKRTSRRKTSRSKRGRQTPGRPR